jgi:hypothetical protein
MSPKLRRTVKLVYRLLCNIPEPLSAKELIARSPQLGKIHTTRSLGHSLSAWIRSAPWASLDYLLGDKRGVHVYTVKDDCRPLSYWISYYSPDMEQYVELLEEE